MRRVTSALVGLTERGRMTMRREWHSAVLTVGVAVLVPVFAISVLALPPSAVERIAGPVLGSTMTAAEVPDLQPNGDPALGDPAAFQAARAEALAHETRRELVLAGIASAQVGSAEKDATAPPAAGDAGGGAGGQEGSPG